MSEDHNFESDVTDHPVEDGSNITDHIQNRLENGTLTGIISNFSINTPGLYSNRAQDAFDALVALWKEKTLVTITTVLRVYENVAIVSIPIARDTDSGESITIQVSFKQVKTVKLQEVTLELDVKVQDLKSNKNRQVAKKTEVGRTTKQNTTANPYWAG
ncbi:MAG: hypothetical protein PVI88_00265 [Nitrosopumilaceae archaeon]